MFECICTSVYVFFFKQKTAYEMRISDWSSDVCSSDLCAHAGVAAIVQQVPVETAVVVPLAGLGELLPHEQQLLAGMTPHEGEVGAQVGEAQIGRASCRERVCQYV